ncbi:hypothetical protein K474DRAFT_729514 [Panus rudis PR-1116 ss-1]|nr:hypothetical protein K474DRAFT_729514 [Panus rudis PR-1116 ss-1]
MSATASQPCILCNRPTTMCCDRCRSAFYCSPEHLQTDWPRHRGECTPIPQSMISMPQQQLPEVSALLFKPNASQYEIIRVRCQPRGLGVCPVPLVQQYFPESVPSTVILTQGLNGDSLRFPLHIFYCATSLRRGSPVNGPIYRITSGAAPKPWAGPVVVLKFTGTRRQNYSDASSNELPALSNYFLTYN